MATPSGSAVIGQSGGPTAVINQSLVGVVEGLRAAGFDGRILGAHHAVRGIIENDFIDLTDCPPEQLELIAQTPSSALGSSRDKPDSEYCGKIIESFDRHDVRHFFYLGGNDSSDTCRIVNEVAKERGHEVHSFHVPKTIDNDLECNDHTPGYGSAARFVACAFMGDDLDNRALPGIKINIVMGRHAGFLTAASRLARQQEGDGPHLIYVPEVSFDVDRFISDVDRVFSKTGRCLIAVSEGIHDANGEAIAAKLASDVERDAHGNVQLSGSGALGDHLSQLIKDRLGKKLRVRADTFGYLQRSFVDCVSPVDRAEARAVGRRAAELSVGGEKEGSIAIRRTGQDPYAVSFDRVELSDVAAKTQTLDPSLVIDGCDISPKFIDYAAPLMGALPKIGRLF